MKEDIHARLDGGIMERVRAYAARNGISLAAALNVLLAKALEGEPS